MQCACGETNSSNAKFCKSCGTAVQKDSIKEKSDLSCPNCKQYSESNKKFCTKCGYKLIDQPSVDQLKQVGNVEKESATLETGLAEESINIEPSKLDSPVKKNHRKTIIMSCTLLVTLILISILYWYFKNTKEQLPISDELSTVNNEVAPDSADNNLPANMEIQTVSDNVLKSFIGKTVKIGDSLGDYFIDSEMKDTKFKVLLANNEYGDVIIDQLRKEHQGFDATHYNYPQNIFINSESACIKNGKPYRGVFVATSTRKLAPPSRVWKVSQDGKLIDETVESLTCSADIECIPESDVCFTVGYNDKVKESPIINKNENQVNTQSKTPKNEKGNFKPLSNNSSEPAVKNDTPSKTIPDSEVDGSQMPQSDSKSESKGIGGFFKKLGESVQKGATVESCSDAQRAMNQCN